MKALTEDGLLDNIKHMSEYFNRKLTALQEKDLGIRQVRICGLMIGIELAVPGMGVMRRCMEEGLLLNCTHETVLRMLLAYNITEKEADHGLEIIERCLSTVTPAVKSEEGEE